MNFNTKGKFGIIMHNFRKLMNNLKNSCTICHNKSKIHHTARYSIKSVKQY